MQPIKQFAETTAADDREVVSDGGERKEQLIFRYTGSFKAFRCCAQFNRNPLFVCGEPAQFVAKTTNGRHTALCGRYGHTPWRAYWEA